mmetsp:Transcript_60934/g.196334  ORF Transcript_60934/g.196334 Transcript_60934/m.196334 type:complete len:290 (-) Transcript_60934:591-1460(-)
MKRYMKETSPRGPETSCQSTPLVMHCSRDMRVSTSEGYHFWMPARISEEPPLSCMCRAAACMKHIENIYMMVKSNSSAQVTAGRDCVMPATMSRRSLSSRQLRTSRSTRAMRRARSTRRARRPKPERISSAMEESTRTTSKIFHFQSAPKKYCSRSAIMRRPISAAMVPRKAWWISWNQKGSSMGGSASAFFMPQSAWKPRKAAFRTITTAQVTWKARDSTMIWRYDLSTGVLRKRDRERLLAASWLATWAFRCWFHSAACSSNAAVVSMRVMSSPTLKLPMEGSEPSE